MMWGVDRDELAHALDDAWAFADEDGPYELADALLSSGVLVAVADVRARAWRWAASFGTMPGKSWPETLRHHAEHGAQHDRDEPEYHRAAHDADVRARALKPFEELFSGSPDTPCRTIWREHRMMLPGDSWREECVEVPMEALRAAFDRAVSERERGTS